jgi:hypothetical protein
LLTVIECAGIHDRRKTEHTSHVFRHPARILVDDRLLPVVSVVSMGEAYFAQSKRENKVQ